EIRQYLLNAALVLALLVPGRKAQEDVGCPGIDEGLELLDALCRCTAGDPALHLATREFYRCVILFQKLLRLLDGRFTVVVDVDVVVQSAGEPLKAAAIVPGIGTDAAPQLGEIGCRPGSGHPAIPEASDAPQVALNDARQAGAQAGIANHPDWR